MAYDPPFQNVENYAHSKSYIGKLGKKIDILGPKVTKKYNQTWHKDSFNGAF